MAVIGDGDRFGLDITYHHESKPLGTFGALAYMENLNENFLVMNGDICTNLNFKDFYENHLKSGATATTSTYHRCERIELGVLTVDKLNQAVKNFQEKPTYDFIMLAKNIDVRACLFDGLWNDIGRLDDYERMLQQFKDDPTAYLPEGA